MPRLARVAVSGYRRHIIRRDNRRPLARFCDECRVHLSPTAEWFAEADEQV